MTTSSAAPTGKGARELAIVITVNGQVGSGGREVGMEVAQRLGLDYVDQGLMVEAAQRLGTTVEALPEQEFFTVSLRDRLARLLQAIARGSALAGTGEVYPEMAGVLARSYEETARPSSTPEQVRDDTRFLEVTQEAVREVAQQGNVVIAGRGSNVILWDRRQTLHVGFVAPQELRIRRLVERDRLSWAEAERRANDGEKARAAFFHKFFQVEPDDPHHYDLLFNLGRIDRSTAAGIVVHQVREMQR